MPLPITTKRLIIRPFTPADLEAMYAVWSDPEVMRPVPGTAYDRDGSWARLSEKISHQGLAERPERVVAIVDPANTRSARVLDKIGMVRNGTWHGFDHEWNLYIAVYARLVGSTA
jgi:RimJ/RimL family protein N-acetyltransferase